MQSLLKWRRDDTGEIKAAKLQQLAQAKAFNLRDAIPILAMLMSIPLPAHDVPLTLTPQQQKDKIKDALVSWLLQEAEQQPVLVVCEDAHWIDPSTLELCERLLDHLSTSALLLVLTCRPEAQLPWSPRPHLTQLTLDRLGREETIELISQLTPNVHIPEELYEQVLAQSDGVPLFVEEIIKMLSESDRLPTSDSEEWLPSTPSMGIPATLHDLLLARLDRLGAAKEVAQMGAVLGRRFDYELLQSVSSLEPAILQQGLDTLLRAELLYSRGAPGQERYSFKHALIQDAAYQSLLLQTRRSYHLRIARVLEEAFVDTAEMQPELLAHHFTQAGEIETAITYWQRASQRARDRSADVEVINHLSKALELLVTLPATVERHQQELTLQASLSFALMRTRGYTALEVARACDRVRELCDLLGARHEQLSVYRLLMGFYMVRAQLAEAMDMANRIVSMAPQLQDPDFELEGLISTGQILHWSGDWEQARHRLEAGLAVYDPDRSQIYVSKFGQDSGVRALATFSHTLWQLGYFDQALLKGLKSLQLAREKELPYDISHALAFLSFLYQQRGETQKVRELSEELITLAGERKFYLWLANGYIYGGWGGLRRLRHATRKVYNSRFRVLTFSSRPVHRCSSPASGSVWRKSMCT